MIFKTSDGKTVSVPDSALLQWAKQFFPHLLPQYGVLCVVEMMRHRRWK